QCIDGRCQAHPNLDKLPPGYHRHPVVCSLFNNGDTDMFPGPKDLEYTSSLNEVFLYVDVLYFGDVVLDILKVVFTNVYSHGPPALQSKWFGKCRAVNADGKIAHPTSTFVVHEGGDVTADPPILSDAIHFNLDLKACVPSNETKDGHCETWFGLGETSEDDHH